MCAVKPPANKAACEKIGTTGKGIGPSYEDKIARRALRVQDLKHPSALPTKLRELLALHNHVSGRTCWVRKTFRISMRSAPYMKQRRSAV